MNALKQWIIEDMIDRLDDIEDLEGYTSDLVYLLYEEDNYNGVIGSYIYYQDAKDWINKFWDELADEMDDYKFGFGEYPNPFENECAFMVKIILNAAGGLITKSGWVSEHWNDKVTYTNEIIKQIKEELQEAIED